ncbi:MAG: hypothetical protein EZS28_002611 [Streblomastix strix]|uniref:Brix domain-containing protein n=1 Tax=Streblomastix strix TaxID=222440 RepID=A0A5J4X3R2_9EUKA|nr:MAG: hypothetical protein EZS28_002611 [Streblomastix strix]
MNEAVPRAVSYAPGKAPPALKQLASDMCKVLEPNSFPKLRINKKNSKKDILHVAGQLGITHLLCFTATETNSYLRLVRLPRGPTLTFQLIDFSCARDVQKIIPHAVTSSKTAFLKAPLIVLSKFSEGGSEVTLQQQMLQHLFPAIDLQKTKIQTCKRVVLFKRDPLTDEIEMRHYYIGQKPAGINKIVQQILEKKLDLNESSHIQQMLQQLEDENEEINALTKDLNMKMERDNEIDVFQNKEKIKEEQTDGIKKEIIQLDLNNQDDTDNDKDDDQDRNIKKEEEDIKVDIKEEEEDELNQLNNANRGKIAVQLSDMGPRIRMKLIKVEDGYFGGEVKYHRYIQKSEAEIKETRERIEKREQERKQRAGEMKAILEGKKRQKEEKLQKKKEKRESKQKQQMDKEMEMKSEEDEELKDEDEDYVGQQKKEKDLKKKLDKSEDDETNDFFSQQMKMVKVKRKREQGREDDSNSNNEDEDESDTDSDSVDDQIRNIDEDSAEEYIRSFQQQRKDEEEIEQELRRKNLEKSMKANQNKGKQQNKSKKKNKYKNQQNKRGRSKSLSMRPNKNSIDGNEDQKREMGYRQMVNEKKNRGRSTTNENGKQVRGHGVKRRRDQSEE